MEFCFVFFCYIIYQIRTSFLWYITSHTSVKTTTATTTTAETTTNSNNNSSSSKRKHINQRCVCVCIVCQWAYNTSNIWTVLVCVFVSLTAVCLTDLPSHSSTLRAVRCGIVCKSKVSVYVNSFRLNATQPRRYILHVCATCEQRTKAENTRKRGCGYLIHTYIYIIYTHARGVCVFVVCAILCNEIKHTK